MPAGYCSWTDRGMRSNEPAVLTYYPDVRKAFIAVSYSPASKGGRFQYTPPCIGVCGDYDMNVGLFQKLLTAGDGHTFSVYNDGNGAMVFVP